jgi:hypothetical protein
MANEPKQTVDATDILIGAAAIAVELENLGLLDPPPPGKDNNHAVYYAAKRLGLPIGRFGRSLISSRARLRRARDSLIP